MSQDPTKISGEHVVDHRLLPRWSTLKSDVGELATVPALVNRPGTVGHDQPVTGASLRIRRHDAELYVAARALGQRLDADHRLAA